MANNITESGLILRLSSDTDHKAGWFVQSYVGEDDEVSIPRLHDGIPIIGIDEGAFQDCDHIKSIILSDNLTYIGDRAFRNCSSLEHVNIMKGVKYIGDLAFSKCSAMTSADILTRAYVDLENVFSDCPAMRYVKCPDGVHEFENGIAADITDVDEDLAYEVDGFIFEKKDDGIYLMDYRGEMTDITLPESVKGEKYEIFPFALSMNNAITSITVPGSVEKIPFGAFRECQFLSSVTLEDGITDISPFAFAGCISLQSIDIPLSVSYIGDGAFYDCISLDDIYYKGEPDDWYEIRIDDYSECFETTTIHCTRKK